MHLAEEKSQRALPIDRGETPSDRSRAGRPGDPTPLFQIGARSSPLSRVQVDEVLAEIRPRFPHLTFSCTWVETTGDLDRTTSLRHAAPADFFTRELDALLLLSHIDLAIHSAKDLPHPLPPGLTLAALTRGLTPADALVFRPGESLATLPPGARIATSSLRREEVVRSLRSDLTFIDLRGTIHERLSLLEQRLADGIVVAEAALLRLNLSHLNRLLLPGETAPLQGRLALVCRTGEVPFFVNEIWGAV